MTCRGTGQDRVPDWAGAKPVGRAPRWGATPDPIPLPVPVSSYGTVTGPAAVFHLNVLPDVPPISPATQNWLVVPGWGAAAL